MKRVWCGLALLPALLVGACGGGDDNPIDIPAKIAALEDCIPDLYPKVDELQNLAALWRQNQGNVPADPAGLTAVLNGNVIDVTYAVNNCEISMEISFWSPQGAQQSPTIDGNGSLGEMIQDAATWLAQQFGNTEPFMLGRWTLSGPSFQGSGNLLGVIGGVANQNELEYIRTTESVVTTGQPATASSVVTNTGNGCELVFSFDPLTTDVFPGQDYADGTINFSVNDGNQTARGTITLDSTAIAVIRVNGVPGEFEFNLDTFDVSYNP